MHSVVAMTSAFTKEPVVLRTLVANLNSVTQISSRLADNLGLDTFRDVYVNDKFWESPPFKWKISLSPVEMRFDVLSNNRVATVHPLVNDHAYWESIAGMDCKYLSNVIRSDKEAWKYYEHEQGIDQNGDFLYDVFDPVDRATPGPRYNPASSYMGHNIRLTKPSQIPSVINEFIEFTCFESDIVQRVAINKHTRQMAVQYKNSNSAPVYVYSQVNYVHIKRMQDQGCVPEVVKEVRASCKEAAVPEFPYAVLMYEYPRNMQLYKEHPPVDIRGPDPGFGW